MANFGLFNDSTEISLSYKPKRSLRKYAENAVSNLSNQCRNSLTRSASTPVPFLRLNSHGTEEKDYARNSRVQSKSLDAGLNRIDHSGVALNKMTQVVDGIRGCYANLMKRDRKRSSLPSVHSSFTNGMPISAQDGFKNYMSDGVALYKQKHNKVSTLNGFNAPARLLNDYSNNCKSDMNVECQLVCMSNNQQKARTEPQCKQQIGRDQLQSSAPMSIRETENASAVAIHNKTTVEYRLTDDHCLDEMPPRSRVCTDRIVLHRPESVSGDAFLVQTVQQRKSRESKKAARKRKRSRHGNGKRAPSSCQAITQMLGNASASIISNLQRLIVSDDGSPARLQTLSFSDDDNKHSGYKVRSAASCARPSDLEKNHDVALQGLSGSYSLASSHKLPNDYSCEDLSEDDEGQSIDDEIMQANMRWAECYGDSLLTSRPFSTGCITDDSNIQCQPSPVCIVYVFYKLF